MPVTRSNGIGGKKRMAKWVYLFKEGNADMRNLLGGKGANLAEMTNLGLPIPQGFVRIIIITARKSVMKFRHRYLQHLQS